ncbi:hypothetical protein AVEN_136958-1 [Araneus ventricosus]|uniref:Uncharacterized protein n=1 Tax=Araneus ventricosus TaxID=182803 RepID=A0A4Y2BK05_ARAVE|nr:hypothetical protein AVEN_136958-1 [Araneus ventricosus]
MRSEQATGGARTRGLRVTFGQGRDPLERRLSPPRGPGERAERWSGKIISILIRSLSSSASLSLYRFLQPLSSPPSPSSLPSAPVRRRCLGMKIRVTVAWFLGRFGGLESFAAASVP